MDDGSQQQAAPASGGSSPPVVDDGQQQAVAAPGGPSPWAGTPLEDLPPLLPPTPGYPEGDQQGEGQPARDEPAQGQPAASPPPTAIFPAGSGNPQAHPSASHPTEGYPTEGYPTEGFPTEEYLGDDDAEDLGLVEASMGPPPRVRLLTVLLVLGIITALGFAGGVLVQRRHDSTLVSAPGAGGFANRAGRGGGVAGGAGGGGFGGGGFGGAGQGTGARAGAGAGGAGGGAGTGAAGGDAAAATPVVVGTVTAVTPTTLTVKNFAGAVVIVHVPAGTPVTTRGLAGLKTGVTVAVTGTKAADGSVTATSVVSRG